MLTARPPDEVFAAYDPRGASIGLDRRAASSPWSRTKTARRSAAFSLAVPAARVVRTVNSEMVLSYWHIGREIVECVQRGKARAGYGEEMIEDLSQHLEARVGRGYSTTNLRYFRDFYIAYRDRSPEIRHIGSGESERDAGATIAGKIRHKRGGASLGSSRSSGRNSSVTGVLDFLGLSGGSALRETDVESAIISKLSQFLLELGKGFAFVARQKRITFEDQDFFVDLVFYNIILKCYLLEGPAERLGDQGTVASASPTRFGWGASLAP